MQKFTGSIQRFMGSRLPAALLKVLMSPVVIGVVCMAAMYLMFLLAAPTLNTGKTIGLSMILNFFS